MTPEAAGLVASVAPPTIACAEIEDTGQALPLHPEEALHVANAVDSRRRDFAAGRYCARAALSRLGLRDVVIGRGPDGSPLWPPDIVGSITHTMGYAAALAARKSEFLSVGLDGERAGRVSDAMMPLLFGPLERAWLESFTPRGRSFAATILFSAKEAYFKAWHPLTGKSLSFPALHVALDEEGFTVTQQDAVSQDWKGPIRGRLAMRGDLVVTAICLPRRGSS